MKLITRDTDYAIRALCYIAEQPEQFCTVANLAKDLKIPRPFLRKILQVLNQEEILSSYKGQGGGFELARKPENIFLVELMKIFQGDFKLNECNFKKMPCPNRSVCILKKKIDSIEDNVVENLELITIASLLKKRRT